MQETCIQFQVRKSPWRRKWQPTPVFLPGESHGQRSRWGLQSWDCNESDMTEWLILSGFGSKRSWSSMYRNWRERIYLFLGCRPAAKCIWNCNKLAPGFLKWFSFGSYVTIPLLWPYHYFSPSSYMGRHLACFCKYTMPRIIFYQLKLFISARMDKVTNDLKSLELYNHIHWFSLCPEGVLRLSCLCPLLIRDPGWQHSLSLEHGNISCSHFRQRNDGWTDFGF